ncbi:hypothetical protein [Dyella sp.]|uniref:hypothetical protein n=1 Tax=Dyella sp. TaxID=1869338 RepID=UPI002FD969C6
MNAGLEKDGDYGRNLLNGQALGPVCPAVRLLSPIPQQKAENGRFHRQGGTMASFGGLRKLLLIHGVITLAAAIVLAVSPGAIPRMAGVHLVPDDDLLAYLLAGAEFGIAFLSFGGSRLAEARALRLIAGGCIVFHATSALLEAYAAWRQMGNSLLVANIVARIVIVALFVWFSRPTAR